MHDRPNQKPADADRPVGAHPLKSISPEQFAALGVESVVFMREIDGEALVRIVPEADVNVADGPFLLVMSADGRPVLVTDSHDSLEAWLDEQPVMLASVH